MVFCMCFPPIHKTKDIHKTNIMQLIYGEIFLGYRYNEALKVVYKNEKDPKCVHPAFFSVFPDSDGA